MDAYDYSDRLKELLSVSTNEVIDISKEFSQLPNNNEKVLYVGKVLMKYNLIPNYDELKQKKDVKLSESFRCQGNELYKKKRFLKALEQYNKSLCFAIPNSQNVGLAYANRSACYSEMKEYEKALENIELARNNNYPKDKLDKLKTREEQCLENLNNKPTTNKFQEYEKAREEAFKLKFPANEKTPGYVANCLELKKSPEFGRYVVTNKDIPVGTVISIEEPFSTRLLPNVRYERCSNCLMRNFLNLYPCDNCCASMFCSAECHESANRKFHKYECGVIDAIDKLFTKIVAIGLRTFFEALSIFENPQEMDEFLKSIKDSNATVFDFDFQKMTELEKRKTLLHTIDALVTNESARSNADMFQRCTVCAILCDLMLNYTDLKTDLDDDRKVMFREFVVKQSQIAALNYHGFFGMGGENAERDVGSGSFPFCSLINHSCAPNVVRVNFESKNYVVVNRPIKANQQIFDNYGFHHCLETFQQRQAGLNSQYKFMCTCEACEAPEYYPLYPHLKSTDRFYQYMMEGDIERLVAGDLETARENFSNYCQYLDKNDHLYPSYEISSLQETILRCLRIFTTSEIF